MVYFSFLRIIDFVKMEQQDKSATSLKNNDC